MFKPLKNDRTAVEPWEYQPAGAITPKMGMALTVTAGKLAICGATVKPTYISMTHRDAACQDGEEIPVIRVSDDIIFETSANAALTEVKLGEKVTLHTDGLCVTATKASGVAELVGMDGTEAGSKVYVRFS